ncbi:5-formyltetrahydrofolate cyclo-ligase [Phlyctema vagabunda]|uniref:5-formyltetrahydrofolate cyclo-ligase n=1 Tax=Phlyctema vagabunda TaxID=108571 RepID=A0ABR4P4Q0_9HELO
MENHSLNLSREEQQLSAGVTGKMSTRAILKAQKKQLRSLMKSKLSSVPEESIRAQSQSIFESLKTFQPYLDAQRVGIYLSMPTGEVQTDAIVRHALGSGKKVFVPYIIKNKDRPVDTSSSIKPADAEPRSLMDMVDLRSLHDYESLKPDAWGIPSISADTIEERAHILKDAAEELQGLDLILMPGVAFDADAKTGLINRLGHGKGFYDYFLERYDQIVRAPHQEDSSGRQKKDVLLYGLALKEQVVGSRTTSEVDTVPTGPFDRSLHGLLVGSGEIKQGHAP